jgi:hypothetical protein
MAPTKNGRAIYPIFGRTKGGFTLLSFLFVFSAYDWLGRQQSKKRDRAVALRQPPEGCIHYTDRGSQYCSNNYQKLLTKHGFEVSMSGKGNCYDNSPLGRFIL